nr:RNA-directed DNA polymerase, eukaryota, reverse transcriptase zinc-binding domain protein [Tanacetum cinerariifolium]
MASNETVMDSTEADTRDEAFKQREAAVKEVGILRGELQQVGKLSIKSSALEETCSSLREQISLLQYQSVGRTDMNEESFRSHTVFILRIRGVNEEGLRRTIKSYSDLRASVYLKKKGPLKAIIILEKKWTAVINTLYQGKKFDTSYRTGGYAVSGDISYQEFKRAVWDCRIDKSSGPDGVTFGFIRRYWSLIEKDVVAVVQHFLLPSLHLSFKIVEDAGMFNGIKINSSVTLSHMFYADEAIFMGQWSKRNIDTLMYMLKCFERASGLSINFSKSKFIGLAVSIEKVKEVTRHIGYGILNTLFSFLGSKVRGCMSRIKSWDEVIDKM